MTTVRFRALAAMALVALAASASGETLARVFPKETLAYADGKPDRLCALAAEWGVDKQRPLAGPLGQLASIMGSTFDEMRPELAKLKSAAAAVVRVDAKTESFVYLAAADLADAPDLRATVETSLARLAKKFGEGAEAIYADEEGHCYAIVCRNVLIVGSDLAEVKSSLARLKGTGDAGFDASEWFQSAPADVAARGTIDVALLYRWLAKAEAKNDDFAALDALLDLKTTRRIDLCLMDGKAKLVATVSYAAANRTGEALRMKALEKRETARYFSIGWGVTAMGAPVDGCAQAKSVKAIVTRFCDVDGDRSLAQGIERIEKLLGVPLEAGMATLDEWSLGLRADAQGKIGGEWLLALKLADPVFAEALKARAGQVRPEGGWATATDGAFFLLASSDAVIDDAREVAKSGKCILDARTAKEALGPDAAKANAIALVNPLGLLPPMPRNPYAPPPSLAGATLVQTDRECILTLDLAQMKGLVKNLQRLMGAK